LGTWYKRGKSEEILLTCDALNGVYDRLVFLRHELIALSMILSTLLTEDSVANASKITERLLPKSRDYVSELRKIYIEPEVPTYLSQHRSHLMNRLSLPPLPKFPEESEVPPS